MGDPKKQRKKYHPPRHPWQGARIDEENEILKEYGLKNKKEIWKMKSVLGNVAAQAKQLAGKPSVQSEKEKILLLKKLSSLGLIAENAQLEDVLALTLSNILDRRLQTFVFKKALAKSMKQAKQFITHGHILVGDKKISAPSYFVLREEEGRISFSTKSPLISETHAERAKTESKKKKIHKERIRERKWGGRGRQERRNKNDKNTRRF
ncbi:30S ribosomal protein S4 [Candidatus Woesearchaeota archaeon]|nr:30S ribosomal protein S4 [Candidatus Woesearchaeota archaeon]